MAKRNFNKSEKLYEDGMMNDFEENIEEDAYLSFIQIFILKYGKKHLTFQCCSLRKAIQNLNSSKLLAFYCHNQNDKFSNVVCSGFVAGEMRTILEKSYNVLSWDLSTNTNGGLEDILDEWLELKTAKHWILTQKSALFIIYVFEESLTLSSILHGDTLTLSDICTQLKDAVNCFQDRLEKQEQLKKIEKEKKKVNDIGSKEFQQMMFDRLGDRDYDSFESDEHRYLKEKIAFARFGPPQTESGYSDNQKKLTDETYNVIIEHNNKYSKWKNRVVVSFIYNCIEPLPEEKLERSQKFSDYNPYTDIMPIPVFVIRKCKGSQRPCRIFVDCDNRVYSSWEDYISNNKLHKCFMVLPKDARYNGDECGNVQLERHASPSCSIQHALFQRADVASSVAGIASGAVFIGAAIPAIAVAPIVLSAASIAGAGVGLYAIFRSGMKIYDRVTHSESMSFSNSEARGAYLNIIAGSLGFVGAGATSAMSQLAADGVHIGEGARAALNVLNVANTGLNAAALANATYEMYDAWSEGGTISTLSIIQLASSVLFFGNAVYNFRTADVLINEAQTNALKNHQESLRSNRHRKTFDKLVKETIRQNNGDTQAGRAEVISTISKISNRDEILAVLTRNNRLFNKEGVRFSAENGRITLNGVVVDFMQMETMSNIQKTQLLIDLPPTPKPNVKNIRLSVAKTTYIFDNVFESGHWLRLAKYAQIGFQSQSFLEIASEIMFDYSDDIKKNIFKVLKKLFEELKVHHVDFLYMCKKYAYNENPYVLGLRYVIQFLKIKMNEYEEKFQDNPNHYYSTLKNLDVGKRAMFWFEKIVNEFISNQVINGLLLNELLEFVISKITLKMHDYCNKVDVLKRRKLESKQSSNRLNCSICGGYYYS